MKYQVCRPLTPIEYEALKADIAKNGVLVPVEVDENGDILDGHHRVMAWQELHDEGINVPQWAKLIRQGLTEEQKRNHARKLNLLRRQMEPSERKQIIAEMAQDNATLEQMAEAAKTSTRTVGRVLANAKTERPAKVTGKDGKSYPTKKARKPKATTLFDPGESAEIEPKAAEQAVRENREERREEIRQDRVDKINDIARGNGPLSAPQRYPVVYADPPWRYEHSKTVNREIENHYPTMSLDEICALPVSDITAPDAILYLWATSPKLEEAMQVVNAWGFTYRTCLVWVKDKIGMGSYARQRHELLLVARRGDIPVPEPENRFDSVIEAPRGEHSAKPAIVYDMIEQMHPEFDKVELFARNKRDNWHSWGNQAIDPQL